MQACTLRTISLVTSLTLIVFFYLVSGCFSHGWMAPEDAVSAENPAVNDESAISRGKRLYRSNCAVCHGDDMAGKDADALGLETGPPNLKERLAMHSDGDFFWKIRQGRNDMPSFKDDLAEEQVWEIIAYIRSSIE